VNVIALENAADYNQPSRMTFENNLVYKFSAALASTTSFPLQVLSVFENNVWDAPTLGSNTNNAQVSFPNAVDAQDIYQHLGCNTKAACVAEMIESPEASWAVRIRQFTFQAYGKS